MSGVVPACVCTTPQASSMHPDLCIRCSCQIQPRLEIKTVAMEPIAVGRFSTEDITPPFGTRAHADPLETRAHELLRTLLAKAPDRLDAETPARFARALTDLVSGYAWNDASIAKMLKCFPVAAKHDGVVVVRAIPFASVCEHHVLPFTGVAAVAYIPTDRIVGLSKIPRLIRVVSRRLQVQERIGVQVADAMMEHVKARGVMVVIRATHSCMTIRGAECPGETVTSTCRGVFLENAAARAEALEMMR